MATACGDLGVVFEEVGQDARDDAAVVVALGAAGDGECLAAARLAVRKDGAIVARQCAGVGRDGGGGGGGGKGTCGKRGLLRLIHGFLGRNGPVDHGPCDFVEDLLLRRVLTEDLWQGEGCRLWTVASLSALSIR